MASPRQQVHDVSEADRALAAASAALARALQGPPRLSTPGQALFASAPIRLCLRPERQELALSGAPAGHPAARELARVNTALAALRKAAPGVRVRGEVVPSPAPGARTFTWLPCGRRPGATQLPEGSTLNPPASPLDVAWSHNAAAIAAAASALAHQASAVVAALSVRRHARQLAGGG